MLPRIVLETIMFTCRWGAEIGYSRQRANMRKILWRKKLQSLTFCPWLASTYVLASFFVTYLSGQFWRPRRSSSHSKGAPWPRYNLGTSCRFRPCLTWRRIANSQLSKVCAAFSTWHNLGSVLSSILKRQASKRLNWLDYDNGKAQVGPNHSLFLAILLYFSSKTRMECKCRHRQRTSTNRAMIKQYADLFTKYGQ